MQTSSVDGTKIKFKVIVQVQLLRRGENLMDGQQVVAQSEGVWPFVAGYGKNEIGIPSLAPKNGMKPSKSNEKCDSGKDAEIVNVKYAVKKTEFSR